MVVQNAETGRDILQYGNLQRRITMIPLDKVKGRVIGSNELKRAYSIVRDIL